MAGDDLLHVADEAHVEHTVGFVEHQDFDRIEAHEALVEQIEQAAGRGDQDIDAAGERVHLGTLADAAEHHRVAQRQVAAVGAEILADLGGELAGRRQDQGAGRAGGGTHWRPSKRCRIGTAKAAVLPVPVWAMPSRSRPASR